MLEGNDLLWSDATRKHLHAADDALQRVAKSFESDDDAEAAVMVAVLGDAVLGVAAALCSSIADVASVLRDRPA